MRSFTAVLILGLSGAFAAALSCTSATPSQVTAKDAGPDQQAALSSLESDPPALILSTQRKDQSSSPVLFDALRGGVWAANGDVGSVSYVDIDLGNQHVVQEIVVGTDVTSVALSPDNKWIAAVDHGAGTVTLIDATSRVIARTLTVGTHPQAAIWDAWDPRWLYVSLQDDNAIAIIDRTRGVLDHVVAAGRVPSGLAVSRLRHELVITQRIDASVSVLPLEGAYSPADQGEPYVSIPLANQPVSDDSTVPNGSPFAFESIAWNTDGNVAWLPHELLANFHPLQFQRVVFPAVSVVDFSARAEVVTDPTTSVIAGRKNLFDAINILDPVGNTTVVSQPCAAAMHPNGSIGYVLACASEDLLTFDVTSGIAIDLLRNLPGDHPMGITLDDTGQRAFVLSDQSHTLLTVDVGGGSPVAHAQVVGGPLALIGKDPIDPEMRAGLKLFFSANSGKGNLPITGNNWLACGGCHLDGFVSTNHVFFDALKPKDATKDAQIGHIGLKDLFSTVPNVSANAATFDPHDVIVAMLDQGGLTPDRTGANRDGAIDPAAPTDDAKQMATRLARVITRDLPLGPSWLLAPAPAPNLTYDAEWCGNCHADEFAAWKKSAHAHSALDPMVKYGMGVEQAARGAQYSRQCAGCHDPVSMRAGDSSLASGRGITCLGCHDASRLIRAGGNADLDTASHDWTLDHKARAGADLTRLRSADFCGGCHQQFVPGSGLVAISTFDEWRGSTYGGHTPSAPPPADDGGLSDATAPLTTAAIVSCIDCHMTKSNGIADHSAPGGNVYLASTFVDSNFAGVVTKNLQSAVGLFARTEPGSVIVNVQNLRAGHGFPTGVTDIREPWLELQELDGNNKLVSRLGGPDTTGLLPSNAARLGIDIASDDGTVLLRHELTSTTKIPFDARVPAKNSLDFVIPFTGALPTGVVHVDAVLFYRNVRTTYFRAATGDATAATPDIEVARVRVY